MKLRDYQAAAVEHLWAYFLNYRGNPIIAMPPGTGKSVVIAAIVSRMIKEYPGTRILVVTDTRELVTNDHNALTRMSPMIPSGIYCSGLKEKDATKPVTFATIGSIYRNFRLLRKIDIVIVDECHLIPVNAAARYTQLFGGLKARNSHLKIIGLTATAYRTGLGTLTNGAVFDSVCFDLTSGDAFVWMIDNGYLCPLIPKQPDIHLDVTGVRTTAGDYNEKDLSDSIDAQSVMIPALRETMQLAADRRRWLVFVVSIEHAKQVADYLTDAGYPAEYVYSGMPNKERDRVIEDFRSGKLRALVNKNILTTGVDFPDLDCIVMLRPTKSASLWVQMLGRGTRTYFAAGYDLSRVEERLAAIEASPKQNCLVLDFARNTERLGPINYPELPKMRKKRGPGVAPVKTCPDCRVFVLASLMTCPECGHEFPKQEKLNEGASTDALIERERPTDNIGIFRVDSMLAVRHSRPGKIDSVKVTYTSGIRKFSHWVLVENNTQYANYSVKRWWKYHRVNKHWTVPPTVQDLLDVFSQLKKPTHIKVRFERSRLSEVIDYDFSGRGFEAPTGPIQADAGHLRAAIPSAG